MREYKGIVGGKIPQIPKGQEDLAEAVCEVLGITLYWDDLPGSKDGGCWVVFVSIGKTKREAVVRALKILWPQLADDQQICIHGICKLGEKSS